LKAPLSLPSYALSKEATRGNSSMSHGPIRIPSKGRCIYCGKDDVKLTDEHFLPLALGGQHIIEKASCHVCAAITSKFEQHVARDMWGDARNSYNATSRRRNRRPTHITLHDPDHPSRTVRIPYSEYPAPMIFYKMNRAGLLMGFPDYADLSNAWQLVAVMDDIKAKGFEEKFGIKLTAQFRNMPESFGRLLAKIGYGQILCNFDPGDFRPLCLPYILGQKTNVSYIVGGTHGIPEPMPVGYNLSTVAFGDQSRIFLVAEIRLYANAYTPVYHVVVGDVLGRDNVVAALGKFDGETSVISPRTFMSNAAPPHHWFPTAWPLPLVA
jgi:5-methylcytosine-specific restriction endonuclease McrA